MLHPKAPGSQFQRWHLDLPHYPSDLARRHVICEVKPPALAGRRRTVDLLSVDSHSLAELCHHGAPAGLSPNLGGQRTR